MRAALAIIGLLFPTLAMGQSATLSNTLGIQEVQEQTVFGFGGVYGRGDMHDFLLPWKGDYEKSIALGVGYQKFFIEPLSDFKLGAEIGIAARLGSTSSLEMWSGVVGRYEGFVLGDTLRISPSLTFGMSVVTNTMGREAEREELDHKSGSLLFYLSPELAFNFVDNEDTELFWRLHHRSSAWRTVGGGSANATAIGIRQRF